MGIPLYKQISGELYADIENGRLRKGERLPSESKLAKEKQVSIGTVKRAYADLENKGYIYKVRGEGSYSAGNTEGGETDGTPGEIAERLVWELSQSGLKMNQIYSAIREQIETVYDELQQR